MLAATLIALLTATPTETSERGWVPETMRRPLRLGVSAAFGAGPRWPYYGGTWETGEVTPFLELPLGRMRVRIGVPLKVGSTDQHTPAPFLGAALGVELRFHLTERFSFGLGAEAGAMIFIQAPPFTGFPFWTVGPSFTPAAIRLGEQLNHELSLSASVLVTNGTVPGGFVFVRYAFLL